MEIRSIYAGIGMSMQVQQKDRQRESKCNGTGDILVKIVHLFEQSDEVVKMNTLFLAALDTPAPQQKFDGISH